MSNNKLTIEIFEDSGGFIINYEIGSKSKRQACTNFADLLVQLSVIMDEVPIDFIQPEKINNL